MEKGSYAVNESPEYNGNSSNGHPQYVDPVTGHEAKTGRIAEAADLYGNIQEAEEYGYVTRGYVSSTAGRR